MEPIYPPAQEFGPTPMPSHLARFDQLKPSDAAVQYMVQRGFDPQLANDHFGISWCHFDEQFLVNHRIIVPIWMDGNYRGWQGRYLGDPPERTPKWYTARRTQVGQLLYNYDYASQWPFVIVCEGVFDVLAVGSPQGRTLPGPAVASFGKKLSTSQWLRLRHHWAPTGAMIVLYDSDAWDTSMQIAQMNQGRFKHGVVPVPLPAGKDPADLPHEELWGLIRKACRICNLDIDEMLAMKGMAA